MSDQPAPHDNEYAEAAGDPGEASGLPVTTGRDPEAGEPDRTLGEEL